MKTDDDPPLRREKENMDAPQEEFIADQSVPSQPMESDKRRRTSANDDTREQTAASES